MPGENSVDVQFDVANVRPRLSDMAPDLLCEASAGHRRTAATIGERPLGGGGYLIGDKLLDRIKCPACERPINLSV